MILADTSVWVGHLKGQSDPLLASYLEKTLVVTHEFVIGELCLGGLKTRSRVHSLLRKLDLLPILSVPELFEAIEMEGLVGAGIGLVDAHLLTSAKKHGVTLYTKDSKLEAAALRSGVSVS